MASGNTASSPAQSDSLVPADAADAAGDAEDAAGADVFGELYDIAGFGVDLEDELNLGDENLNMVFEAEQHAADLAGQVTLTAGTCELVVAVTRHVCSLRPVLTRFPRWSCRP